MIREGQERGEIATQSRGGANIPNGNTEGATVPKTLAELDLTTRQSQTFQKIASIPEEKFEAALAKATDEAQDVLTELTTAALVRGADADARQAERKDLVAKIPKGKFAVILADPPWQYDNSGFNESAESQYPTMPTDDICNMAEMVKGFSTPETVLFLWATNPMLLDALKVLEAWGFTYKTNIAWIKDMGRGKGWFLKSKHELILIGTRENTPHPDETNRPDSCFEADRGPVHSRKPEKAYEIIESMFDGTKLEMFCRGKARKGWKSHGNQVSTE